MTDFIYDVESYPNVFILTAKNVFNGKMKTFECSPWQNDYSALRQFLTKLKKRHCRMVGFNNMGYDWPVVHAVMLTDDWSHECASKIAYEKTKEIINGHWNDRFKHIIWQPAVPQIDLYKIHHFDNKARSISLKVLEFNMRSSSIQDLPFPPDTELTKEETAVVVEYNIHDVNETHKFYDHSVDMIRFREELTKKYSQDFVNFNDTKIGKQ